MSRPLPDQGVRRVLLDTDPAVFDSIIRERADGRAVDDLTRAITNATRGREEMDRLRAENDALREDMLRFRTAAQVNTPESLQKFVLDITGRRLGLGAS